MLSTPDAPATPPVHAPTQDELNLEHYASRLDRPVLMKAPDFQRGDRLRLQPEAGQETTANEIDRAIVDGGYFDFLAHVLKPAG